MARIAKGRDVLEKAVELMHKARTADELRVCQAVIFPLTDGLSIKQTAARIGRSISWTIRNRSAFIEAGGFAKRPRPGGRKRANMSIEEELAFLEPFFEKAKSGGILVAGELHKALGERLGRKVALASVYNLLHRHNWRKLSPDRRHVKADPQTQECWKKNSVES